jgi:hypothetical protein
MRRFKIPIAVRKGTFYIPLVKNFFKCYYFK